MKTARPPWAPVIAVAGLLAALTHPLPASDALSAMGTMPGSVSSSTATGDRDQELPIEAITAHALREVLRIDAGLPPEARSLLTVFLEMDVRPRHTLEGRPLGPAAIESLDWSGIRWACLIPTEGSRHALDLRPSTGAGSEGSPAGVAPSGTAGCLEVVAHDLPASAMRGRAVRMYGAGNVIFSSADYGRFSPRLLEELHNRADVLRPQRSQTLEERVGAPVDMNVVVVEVRGDVRALLFGGE